MVDGISLGGIMEERDLFFYSNFFLRINYEFFLRKVILMIYFILFIFF